MEVPEILCDDSNSLSSSVLSTHHVGSYPYLGLTFEYLATVFNLGTLLNGMCSFVFTFLQLFTFSGSSTAILRGHVQFSIKRRPNSLAVNIHSTSELDGPLSKLSEQLFYLNS